MFPNFDDIDDDPIHEALPDHDADVESEDVIDERDSTLSDPMTPLGDRRFPDARRRETGDRR